MKYHALSFVLAAAALPAAGFAQYNSQQQPVQAGPGTLNYVEGQVALNGRTLTQRAVGRADLATGETLETAHGKAEILLTPGVFLRLGDNAAVTMVSPSLTNTELRLDRGEADVEVDDLYRQNHIAIDTDGQQGVLLKNGLYSFNAGTHSLNVFSGKAAVFQNNEDGPQKPTIVKGSRELSLNGDGSRPEHFDKNDAQDGLYNWSSLRSDYLGEANTQLAEQYSGYGGFAPGWFWDESLLGYTWLPGGGAFFSPFGYGFYSPYYLNAGGLVYGRYGYGGRGYGLSGYRLRGPVAGGLRGGFHGPAGEGFHGGGGSFHGGGGAHR